MKHYEVVAAIIMHEGKYLCVQRGDGKYTYVSRKFEFPGGKMEVGETKEEAIKREIAEELQMNIEVKSEFLTVHHDYPDFKLTMHSLLCECENSDLTLTEHIDFKWLSKNDLPKLDWAPADIPIVDKLMAG